EYAKEIMPELNPNIALFPPVLLDNLTTSSYWRTVNKVPRHYKSTSPDEDTRLFYYNIILGG
ncbi:MAG: hypothetical protein ABIL86_09525, partial [candidate division WOR-3 bacterium]